MSDDQAETGWLARWREKRQRKHHRTAMDKFFGTGDDSDEKIAEHYTTRGSDIAAKDDALRGPYRRPRAGRDG